MVESVNFGPARPFPQSRLVTPNRAERREHVHNAQPAHPQSLSLASALAHLGPPFDASKVASLRAAIASGSYQIDLGKIADGIVRFGVNDHV